MKKGQWTFLSNHGRVLIYISQNPESTTEDISHNVQLSLRGVQKIIDELEAAGYITRRKEGRRNTYILHPEMPMRHHLESGHAVSDIIEALGRGAPESTEAS
jgi:predicted transcriptional regulator